MRGIPKISAAALLALACATATAQTTTTAPATASAPAIVRVAAPTPEAIRDASAQVTEITKTELEAARSPEQKKAVAVKLLGIAAEEKDPARAAVKYALLAKARDIGQDAGDFDCVKSALRGLAAQFEIDAIKMEADAYMALARTTRANSDRKDLADEISRVLHAALDQDRFEIAKALALTGTTNAQSIGDPALSRAALADTMEVRESELAFADVKKAVEVLAARPSDAEANFKVGKYRCLLRNDWEQGLSMLALGSDAAMKALAEKEIAGVTDSDEQLKIADAWWEIAEKATGTSQANMRMHAGKWYQTALPTLTGLNKARVEKRLATIDAAKAALRPSRVDLLAAVDTTKDLVAGTWTKANGQLKSGENTPMRLQLPYHPPAEYDFHIEFVRDSGDSDVAMILAGGGKQFVYAMGDRLNTLIGFEMIGKVSVAGMNKSTAKYTGIFENGKRYDVTVKVRKSGLEAIINGKVVTTWKTDFSDLSMPENWTLNDKEALGIGTFRAAATFYKMDVTEVSGSGTTIRK